jgi:hypothetical protein
MSYVRAEEKRPCTEEKKRFRKAQLRRETCEQKLRTLSAAISFWEAERNKTQSKIQRCRDLAESGMLVAIENLRGQIERLRTYAGLRSNAFAEDMLPAGEKTDSESAGGTSDAPASSLAAGNEPDTTAGDADPTRKLGN